MSCAVTGAARETGEETALGLERSPASAPTRTAKASSQAHRYGAVDPDDPHSERGTHRCGRPGETPSPSSG